MLNSQTGKCDNSKPVKSICRRNLFLSKIMNISSAAPACNVFSAILTLCSNSINYRKNILPFILIEGFYTLGENYGNSEVWDL